ncbi:MAG: hypothetical protein ISN29_10700, partial [Gammaproteobacteria bacterium AqS3]|nr:hypothetical protein [Gammaproteobacteria bacterium AqS3]
LSKRLKTQSDTDVEPAPPPASGGFSTAPILQKLGGIIAAGIAALTLALIAVQSPAAAAQQVTPAKDCAKLNQGGDKILNNCSYAIRIVGRTIVTGDSTRASIVVAAGNHVSAPNNNTNACIEYSDAERQRDSGYAACPDNSDADNYPISGSLVLGYADKLDADLRDLPSELTLEEGASGQFTFRLTTSPEQNTNDPDVTVTIAQPAASTGVMIDTDDDTSNNNQNTLTFTGDNWGTLQTVYVRTTEDADAAVPADLTISLTASGGGSGDYSYASVTGSVTLKQTEKNIAGLTLDPTDLDVRRDGTNTFTVKLQAQPTDEVEVTLTQPASSTGVTVDTDTSAANNQTTLTFTTTDWNTAQTVTVSATGTAPLGNDAATISLSASGSDATEYASVTGSVTIDVEARLPALVISPSPLTVGEGRNGEFMVKLNQQPTATVTVTLTQPTNTDVTVDTDTGAANNQTELMFTTTDWNTDQSVRVSALEDDDIADDTASIALSAAGGNFDNVKGTLTVNVTDNEVPGLTLMPSALTVNEGGSQTFDVKLTLQPTATVTVTLTQPTDEGPANADVTIDTGTTGDQSTLTFTTGNWSTAQTVTVSAAEDDDVSNDIAKIKLTAAGGDYDSITG